MSKIEWTNVTWNPIIGCSKVSAGCNNCYAERMAYRLSNMKTTSYYRNVLHGVIDLKNPKTVYINQWSGKTYFIESALNKTFEWKKPQMIFVCSMGDLFHESVPFEWIDSVFTVMSDCDQHTYQILTKRPKRALDFVSWKWQQKNIPWFPKDNIWFGVTVENQEQANQRIPELIKVPAKVRFLSCEPLLENIVIDEYCPECKSMVKTYADGANGEYIGQACKECDSYTDNLMNSLNWVITGPETGPSKRPIKREWIENLYQQCKAANVPFFDKKDVLGLGLKQLPLLK